MLQDILPNSALLADLSSIPAKRGVCLLLDSNNAPIQSLAFANLREGVKRRLDETPENTPRKKTRLASIAHSALFVLTFSPFESDWLMDQTLRAAFPDRVAELIKYPVPAFLELSLALPTPKFKSTNTPQNPAQTLGPFPDLSSAQKMADLLEDLQDLCRYPHILAQAPNGKPCVYKEIGRCDAPCDGSVPLSSYLNKLSQSLLLPLQIPAWIDQITLQMTQFASNQKFEQAKRLKTAIDTLKKGFDSEFKWLSIWQNWQIYTLQPGPDENSPKRFKISPQGVLELQNNLPLPRKSPSNPAELGFVMKHLFSKTPSLFLPSLP